jgi:hypothetical protein
MFFRRGNRVFQVNDDDNDGDHNDYDDNSNNILHLLSFSVVKEIWIKFLRLSKFYS